MKYLGVLASGIWLGSSWTLAAGTTPPTKPYTVVATILPSEVKVGASAKLEIAVAAQAPYHIKAETPFRAALTPSAGLQIAKAELDAHDFVDAKAETKTAACALTAKQPGAQQVRAELTFFLCTEEMCQRFQEQTVANVRVGP
jgi:hypothetical protein